MSEERWQQAQRWERALWRRSNRLSHNAAKKLLQVMGVRKNDVGDDWNHWWAGKFNHYKDVPHSLENAVEFGCGPYTNLRIILKGRTTKHSYCCDPLIRDYLAFRYTWLAEAYRHREILIDDHPLEEAPFAVDYFDLVVLINVIDHVRDAVQCLEKAISLTRPNGLLILGQDLTNEDDRKMGSGDIGHPIVITHEQLDVILSGRFEKMLYRVLHREEGRNPAFHYATYLLIGRKLRS